MNITVRNLPIAAADTYDGAHVRPLGDADSMAFHAMCARLPMRTLTPRLNVEAHGFQGSVVRSWGVFNRSDMEMEGLLLRYGNTAVAVDHDGRCAPAFARLIDKEHNIAGVRGSLEVVSGIQALLHRYTPSDWEDSYFLVLRKPAPRTPPIPATARRAGPEDRDLLTELYSGAGPMYRSRSNVASKLAETRVFVVEESADGRHPRRIASCALLNVEGKDAGLIGGVYTLPSARGKSYAAACTSLLAADLQRDGKTPCLFYENPIAGKVYRRLGFEDASRWAVLYLAPQEPARSER
jgi:predicted GNAT family acetyltransferase